jgi:hypothetical protein
MKCSISLIAGLALYWAGGSLAGFAIADQKTSALTKNDFAYGIEFFPGDKQAMQAVLLPEHFYQNLVSPNGGDFRVFDAHGQLMPFTVKQLQLKNENKSKIELAFYPVYTQQGDSLDSLALSLGNTDQGISLLINNKTSESSANSTLAAYIVDRQKAKNLHSLDIEWREPRTGFIGPIKVEGSNDLIHWSTLVRDASLSRFEHQQQFIGNSTIFLPLHEGRYLRISWVTDRSPFLVTSVVANVTDYRDETAEKTLETNLTLRLIDSDTLLPFGAAAQNSYQFELPENLPIVAIELISNNDNYFFLADVYSHAPQAKTSEKSIPWLAHGELNQYRLTMSEQQLVSSAKVISSPKHRQWLLSFREPKNYNGGDLPQVKMSWLPEQLIFIAQGQPPYTLAYGNPNVETGVHQLSSLFARLKPEEWQNILARVITLPAPIELGGVSKLVATASPFPWKTLALWLVLILGVTTMAVMAYRLLRDSQTRET